MPRLREGTGQRELSTRAVLRARIAVPSTRWVMNGKPAAGFPVVAASTARRGFSPRTFRGSPPRRTSPAKGVPGGVTWYPAASVASGGNAVSDSAGRQPVPLAVPHTGPTDASRRFRLPSDFISDVSPHHCRESNPASGLGAT